MLARRGGMGSSGFFSHRDLGPVEAILISRRKRRKLLSGPGSHSGVALLDADRNVIAVYDLTRDREIRTLSLEAFLEGREAHWDLSSGYDGLAAVLARLDQARNDPDAVRFHLTNWNCETFARWVVTGEAKSQQANGAVIAGLLALSAWAFR